MLSVLTPSGTLAISSSGSYAYTTQPSINLMDIRGERRRYLTTNTRKGKLIRPIKVFGRITSGIL